MGLANCLNHHAETAHPHHHNYYYSRRTNRWPITTGSTTYPQPLHRPPPRTYPSLCLARARKPHPSDRCHPRQYCRTPAPDSHCHPTTHQHLNPASRHLHTGCPRHSHRFHPLLPTRPCPPRRQSLSHRLLGWKTSSTSSKIGTTAAQPHWQWL